MNELRKICLWSVGKGLLRYFKLVGMAVLSIVTFLGSAFLLNKAQERAESRENNKTTAK